MRNHVSFVAEFPKTRGDDGSPPGLELATWLSTALGQQGLDTSDRDETDYSCTIAISHAKHTFNAMLGLVDDVHPREWLFFVESRLGRVRRLFGQSDDQELSQVLAAVHEALVQDPRRLFGFERTFGQVKFA